MRNITIEFSYGSKDDQTGIRVLNAYDQIENHFLLLYGYNYWRYYILFNLFNRKIHNPRDIPVEPGECPEFSITC